MRQVQVDEGALALATEALARNRDVGRLLAHWPAQALNRMVSRVSAAVLTFAEFYLNKFQPSHALSIVRTAYRYMVERAGSRSTGRNVSGAASTKARAPHRSHRCGLRARYCCAVSRIDRRSPQLRQVASKSLL